MMRTNKQHPLEARRQLAKQAGFYVPDKPRSGHIPKWLERSMRKAGYTVNRYIVPNQLNHSWCDHWGSGLRKRCDSTEPIFIAEPYGLTNDGLTKLMEFVTRCGLDVVVKSSAYHNSGCVRIEISEPVPYDAPLSPADEKKLKYFDDAPTNPIDEQTDRTDAALAAAVEDDDEVPF